MLKLLEEEKRHFEGTQWEYIEKTDQSKRLHMRQAQLGLTL
jgi:hypothetical protein